MRPPFQLGKATPDINSGGEFEERLKLEAQMSRDIANYLGSQAEDLFPKRGPVDQQQVLAKVDAMKPALVTLVGGWLLKSAMMAATRIDKELDAVGLPFDIIDVDDKIKEWINNYSFNLVGGIIDTTKRQLQKKMTRWVDSGAPLDELVKDVAVLFGKRRAEAIASTEITRAYTEGNIAAWLSSGVANMQPEEKSPKHVRCRCWITITKRNGVWVYVWNTAHDERVCPVCSPLNNQSVGVAYA